MTRPRARRTHRLLALVLACLAAGVLVIGGAVQASAHRAAGTPAGSVAEPYPAATPPPSQPSHPTSPSPSPSPSQPGNQPSGGQTNCGVLDLNCQVQHAVSGWFADLVKSAIEPVFGTVGRSLLSTPRLDQWSRVTGLWTGSLVVANSVFVLMVVVAGLILMGHQSLQTSYTVKDIAPRLVLGVVLSNMSLLLIGKAIYAANGLSAALVSQGVNVDQAADQMSKIVSHAIVNPDDIAIFLVLVAVVAVVLGLILLLMFVVRMMVTILLIAAAPLALACHALPQTESLAKLWWRALTGVLAIQVAQALVFIAAMRVVLTTDMVTWFGMRTPGDTIDLLIVVCLLYVLIRIPSWISRMVMAGGMSRSPIVRAVRTAISLIVFRKLLHHRGAAGRPPGGRPPGGRPPGGRPPGGRPPRGRPSAGGHPPAAGSAPGGRPPRGRPPGGRSATRGGDGAVVPSQFARRAPTASWLSRNKLKRAAVKPFRKPAVRGRDGSTVPTGPDDVLEHAPRVRWPARQRAYPPRTAGPRNGPRPTTNGTDSSGQPDSLAGQAPAPGSARPARPGSGTPASGRSGNRRPGSGRSAPGRSTSGTATPTNPPPSAGTSGQPPTVGERPRRRRPPENEERYPARSTRSAEGSPTRRASMPPRPWPYGSIRRNRPGTPGDGSKGDGNG